MTCQWLYGEPTLRNFCGRRGTPWCDFHRERVYRPAGEVNTFGIEEKRPAKPKRGPGGSLPKETSIAGKIRRAIAENPNTPTADLAEQMGCSRHHVQKVRRQFLGPANERNKAAEIRAELEKGLKPAQIARKLGCDESYARAVRYRMKQG